MSVLELVKNLLISLQRSGFISRLMSLIRTASLCAVFVDADEVLLDSGLLAILFQVFGEVKRWSVFRAIISLRI